MIWFRRRLNRRRWRARQRARARDKHIKSPNENSTSKNIPQKKTRRFQVNNTYRHHAGEGRRGERQRGVRRLFRLLFERVSFLGGHFAFGGNIYRTRENS